VRIELARRGDDVALAVSDDGPGLNGSGDGTGLSIVRALVREELQGTISFEGDGGLRAEVVFPA
jgi:two-component sensor histidine kinase